MESCTQPQLHSSKLEEVLPNVPSKNRVAIADNRSWEAVKSDNAFEESFSHGRRCVRVVECQEVRLLGEHVDDRQNDTFSMNPREALHKIEGDVRPHLRWHVQGLEQPSPVCSVLLCWQVRQEFTKSRTSRRS